MTHTSHTPIPFDIIIIGSSHCRSSANSPKGPNPYLPRLIIITKQWLPAYTQKRYPQQLLENRWATSWSATETFPSRNQRSLPAVGQIVSWTDSTTHKDDCRLFGNNNSCTRPSDSPTASPEHCSMECCGAVSARFENRWASVGISSGHSSGYPFVRKDDKWTRKNEPGRKTVMCR